MEQGRERELMGRHNRTRGRKRKTERKDIICQWWCLSVLSVKKTTSEEEQGSDMHEKGQAGKQQGRR